MGRHYCPYPFPNFSNYAGMSNKTKDVWGVNLRYPSKADITRKPPPGPRKPVKSKKKHGKPIKTEDVSDGGGGLFILVVIFLLFLLIVFILW